MEILEIVSLLVIPLLFCFLFITITLILSMILLIGTLLRWFKAHKEVEKIKKKEDL